MVEMVEVQAGSDQDHPGEEVRPHIENCCQNRNTGFPNSPCKTHHRIGRQFGKIRPEMRSERGKAHVLDIGIDGENFHEWSIAMLTLLTLGTSKPAWIHFGGKMPMSTRL